MEYFYLFSGFILLLLSGHLLVKGGVSLARHLKISTLVVGVTVVAFGTSAPELFVSMQAVFKSHHDISLGNVIGSNISNIGLVLAVTSIIFPMAVNRKTVVFDWPVMMGMSILCYILLYNKVLSSLEGVVFILLLVIYIYWSINNSRRENKKLALEVKSPRYSIIVSIIIIILASLGLMVGSDWLVNRGAVIIAQQYNISERIISITIIALGTSLPELATSAVAAMQKEPDISVGNIIGSNIFNILAVLGITSLVKPIIVQDEMTISFDLLWMLGISLLLFIMILPLKGGKIFRWKGAILAITYFAYIFLLIGIKDI